jgi:transposase
MIYLRNNKIELTGEKGKIELNAEDKVLVKLGMLYEGECEGLGATAAAKKFGYTRQRYYQLLNTFKDNGLSALEDKKPGPQSNYRRTAEAVREVIKNRFLDPDASEEVIAQKMVQCGFKISGRSVQRVISEFGLQKKTIKLSANKRPPDADN